MRAGIAVSFALGALGALDPSSHPSSPSELDDSRPERPRVVDPGVAIGSAIRYAERPPSAAGGLRACSVRVPLCVHGERRRDASAAAATLDAFERAWEILTGPLGAPPPDVDPSTLVYDVFLDDGLGSELARTELEARDVRSRFDRGRGFSRVDRRLRAGCLLDAIAVRSVARASLLRVAPATDEATALGQSAYLAQLAAPCSVALAGDEIAAFQSRAFAALPDAHAGEEAPVIGTASERSRSADLYATGSAAFWARIDWAFGRAPGTVVTASWALSPTMTPTLPPPVLWTNEPDTFDVLRTTFKDALSTGSTVADLWLDFGVARAFLGSADDGLHAPELHTLGDSARIVPDWDIPWPTAPRRLAGRRPLAPTGAGYVIVRRAGARPGARLRAEIEWEEHALFRWAFVKVDAAGRELGRVVIPMKERATSAQMTLVDIDGVDRVVLVGVNVGDPAYAFDPDDEVWEPHGWLVTVAEE